MINLIGRAQAVNASDLMITFDLSHQDLFGLIATAINALLALVGAIAVVYFIYGGVLYITAGGDAEKATKGRTVLLNAIIGIIIIVAALAITNFVHARFS